MIQRITNIQCKACNIVMEEADGFHDACPNCGATGGEYGSWWNYR